MSTALDPAVIPYLVPAVVAVLVIFSSVGAILVLFGRVRIWLRTAFQEFTESAAFKVTIQQILDQVADKMLLRVETQIEELRARDVARREAVTRVHQRNDELSARIEVVKQQTTERIDRLFDRTTDIVDRMPPKRTP